LKRLEKAGIEVVYWFSQKLTYAGQHRKMMIVDNQHVVAGGLNFGDVYSHKNPDLKIPRWRDTDIYLKGSSVAAEANQLFASLWNEQLTEQKNTKFKALKIAKVLDQNQKGTEIRILNHNPLSDQKGSTIMLTTLKAIREAKNLIDIENAYIILFPALKTELANAIKRGVQVRVFTNSSESIDEPVVTIPILRSVLEFVKMGAKVFVKKGATLHSKIMAIDSDFAIVMSYNLHPRSERVEGEMAIATTSPDITAEMHKIFDEDVSSEKAYELKTIEDVKIPQSGVSVPTLRLFFDML
jgi:cardiolipin synthase A/B